MLAASSIILLGDMRHLLHHIVRGCGELPTFGHHPGTPIVIMFIIAFTIATGWHGLLVSCLLFLPIYLWGAYHRSIDDPEK
jgi:hypothetical protein